MMIKGNLFAKILMRKLTVQYIDLEGKTNSTHYMNGRKFFNYHVVGGYVCLTSQVTPKTSLVSRVTWAWSCTS